MSDDFVEFRKIPRMSRECVITEKIDGTNCCVLVGEDGSLRAGSRTRWIDTDTDHFGFALWVKQHADELRGLGPGTHFGEWWGVGIQRGYGLHERRWSLFNVGRWSESRPACCHVVPVLWRGNFCDLNTQLLLENLMTCGSAAAPGFMRPEGIVIYHKAANVLFKRTIEKDEQPKGKR